MLVPAGVVQQRSVRCVLKCAKHHPIEHGVDAGGLLHAGSSIEGKSYTDPVRNTQNHRRAEHAWQPSCEMSKSGPAGSSALRHRRWTVGLRPRFSGGRRQAVGPLPCSPSRDDSPGERVVDTCGGVDFKVVRAELVDLVALIHRGQVVG